MHDSISTHGLQRPRVRRGLGIVVGAAMLVTPVVAAPVANAGTASNLTPQSLAALIAQLPAYIVQIIEALTHTLSHPLGEQAPNSQGCSSGELVSATLTCNVIGPAQNAIGGPGKAKAKVTASMKRGKVAKVRWVSK